MDVDKMVVIYPSWNTDQGVYDVREYDSVETMMRNESKIY